MMFNQTDTIIIHYFIISFYYFLYWKNIEWFSWLCAGKIGDVF